MTHLDFFDTPGPFDLPPDEAIAYFRRKGLRQSFAWQDVLAEEHDAAFTVAKMMDVDLLKDVYDSLDVALAEGVQFREWADQLVPMLQARGWWGRKEVVDPLTGETVVAQLGSPGRLQTIFRTNMQSAYAQGQWEQMEAQAEDAPFVMYDAVDDWRTRQQHREWDGTVVPITAAWLRHHTPPCGWNCRCGLIQLDKSDLESLGVKPQEPPTKFYSWENPRTGKTERVPEGVDPGFGESAKKRIERLEELLDEKIVALPPDAEKAAKSMPEPPPFDATTAAGLWHSNAWGDAPDWLKPLVVREQTVEVLRGKGGAWARSGRTINMPPDSSQSSPHDLDTWRHEFGHILDVRLARGAYVSSGREFTEAMQADSKDLVKRLNIGLATKTKQKRVAYEAEYLLLRDELVDMGGSAERQAALEKMAKAADVDLPELVAVLQANSALEFTGSIAADLRLARVLKAIKARDPEQFVRYAIGLDLVGEFATIRASWNKGGLGSFSDLFGAATKNKVANISEGFWGHDNAYYRKRKDYGQQTEAFANLTALAAGPHRLLWDLVKRMAPKMAAAYEEIISNGNN